MSGENAFWLSLKPVLDDLKLDPHRVENILHPGWPDVDYIHGIIELKALTSWPARTNTRVQLEFKPGQVPVLMRRWKAGGLCWIFARVADSWFLFDGWTSQRLKEGPSQAEFRSLAIWTRDGRKAGDTRRLLGILTDDEELMPPCDRAKMHRLRACKTVQQVAEDIGWTPAVVMAAEWGDPTSSTLTDDLLAYWEN